MNERRRPAPAITACRHPGHRLAAAVLAALTWAAPPALGAGTPEGRAALPELPASYEGELSGADGAPVRWHLDLLPSGRYRLRSGDGDTRLDDIGRWWSEPDTGRLALRGSRGTPFFFLPLEDGAGLRPLDAAGRPTGASHDERLQRLAQAAPIEPRLELTGMFRYLADAPTITLCADDGRLPVAMEADYRALEAAYLTARQPGEALLVSLEGSVATRPSPKAGQPPQPSLVVERFIAVWPRESCGTPLADSPLRGTYWKLVRLGDTPATTAEQQREPHLILASGEPRVAGSGGCNRVMGSFELDGDRLRFGQMAGTRMACPDGMAQEQDFLKALTRVERYRIRGSHLEMLNAAGAVVARFEAVALR
ncbi:META domain-containing protein [Azotobacter chroococcum]|uniref:META domain-containing protein n=1 Tax=Azotobacter chroococcum TaxID=353 RepID=UPI0018E01804|nr:META domain-containing protein [Azotobacter chroococcum]